MKLPLISAITIVGLAVGQVLYASTGTQAVSFESASSPCASLAPRHVEVCSAYIANASLGARWPYYQFGHDANPARAAAATQRLESRYTDGALSQIFAQTAGWPGHVDATRPSIEILSVAVTPDQNFATITTSESWSVRDEQGNLLLSETNAYHTVSLSRVPGLILHKWVVTDIR